MDAGVLTKETVSLNVEAADWAEAIRKVGSLLLNAGAVDQSYVDAMVTAVKAKGPYIVVAPGVAMPHASPDYAKRVGLAVMRLKQPVVFGKPENDPVDLLFCLCSPDFMSHMSALIGLTMFIENPGALAELRAAPDAETVVRILESNIM
ncbi:MAG TPA: PTS sugar transporter subunit IIA [Symbiobacteriaceae bacterium]|jgi:mannitol/fructose-specific phosphotransferase system IIA component (Ntr-type)